MILQTEIAVVGGGPAGALIALRLARLGHDVMLIAGMSSPRSHGNETFTPGVAQQLAFLDLEHALERAVVRPPIDIELKWHSDRYEPHASLKAGFLVNRSTFDAGLVAAASLCGVIIYSADMRSAERTADGWRLACDSLDGPLTLIAPMLIDAAGRRGVLPRKRRRNYSLLGIHGRWQGTCLPQSVRITAGAQSWAWGAPVADHTYEATVFLDPRNFKRSPETLEQRYCALVRSCGLLDGAKSTELTGSVRACDATPYVDTDAVGADFLKLGDACLAVDPLSSAGVQIALQSAISGAIAVHTLRCDPTVLELVADFWTGEIARRSSRHMAWTAELYEVAAERFDTLFWRTRAAFVRSDVPPATRPDRDALPDPRQALHLSDSLRFSDALCIVGNIIERRRSVTHPSLAEPVAFLDGINLPNLLGVILPGMTAAAVLSMWSRHVAPGRAVAILSWIWQRGFIEPFRAG